MASHDTELLHVGIHHHVVAIEASSGREVWRRPLEPRNGAGSFTTVFVDGAVVLAGNGGEAFCLDASSGTPLWHARLPRLGLGLVSFAAQPAASGVHRGPVFVGIKSHVVALDRASGAEEWRQALRPRRASGSFTTVLLDDDRLFAASGGEVFCLDPRTGSPRWQCELPKLGTGLVAFAGRGASGSYVAAALAMAQAAAATIAASS